MINTDSTYIEISDTDGNPVAFFRRALVEGIEASTEDKAINVYLRATHGDEEVTEVVTVPVHNPQAAMKTIARQLRC